MKKTDYYCPWCNHSWTTTGSNHNQDECSKCGEIHGLRKYHYVDCDCGKFGIHLAKTKNNICGSCGATYDMKGIKIEDGIK